MVEEESEEEVEEEQDEPEVSLLLTALVLYFYAPNLLQFISLYLHYFASSNLFPLNCYQLLAEAERHLGSH